MTSGDFWARQIALIHLNADQKALNFFWKKKKKKKKRIIHLDAATYQSPDLWEISDYCIRWNMKLFRSPVSQTEAVVFLKSFELPSFVCCREAELQVISVWLNWWVLMIRFSFDFIFIVDSHVMTFCFQFCQVTFYIMYKWGRIQTLAAGVVLGNIIINVAPKRPVNHIWKRAIVAAWVAHSRGASMGYGPVPDLGSFSGLWKPSRNHSGWCCFHFYKANNFHFSQKWFYLHRSVNMTGQSCTFTGGRSL